MRAYPDGMSTLRNPVGPQPPSVYWRRRLLVGLGALAVVIVIILIIVRPGGGTPGPDRTTPPASSTESPEPNSTPTSDPADADACDPSDVQLVPVTDAGSYAPEAIPQISMTITNVGADPCTFDVGTAAQEYIITSGADRIWSSRDCQTEGTEDVRVLEPGQELATTPFPWDRTRSSTDTCTAERPAVIGNASSYHLSVIVGESESADTRQFILE
jgi:hypothetical protein